MLPNLAQVLNTLAHEIRTPLAVSQGYLKLFLDGRLTNAEDQRRAFQQTREALGTLATLCQDMGRVSALSESPAPALAERIAAGPWLDRLREEPALEGAAWSGGVEPPAALATHAAADLSRAVAIVAKAAFDEAREQPRHVRVSGGDSLVVLAGPPEAIALLGDGPDAPGTHPVDFARGGKGLRLIWAAFVLEQHRVQTWTHQDHRATVGFLFPMVSA